MIGSWHSECQSYAHSGMFRYGDSSWLYEGFKRLAALGLNDLLIDGG